MITKKCYIRCNIRIKLERAKISYQSVVKKNMTNEKKIKKQTTY